MGPEGRERRRRRRVGFEAERRRWFGDMEGGSEREEVR